MTVVPPRTCHAAAALGKAAAALGKAAATHGIFLVAHVADFGDTWLHVQPHSTSVAEQL